MPRGKLAYPRCAPWSTDKTTTSPASSKTVYTMMYGYSTSSRVPLTNPPSHMDQLKRRQPIDLRFDAVNESVSGARIILGDPPDDTLEVVPCGGIESYSHAPDERRARNTSSAGIRFGSSL